MCFKNYAWLLRNDILKFLFWYINLPSNPIQVITFILRGHINRTTLRYITIYSTCRCSRFLSVRNLLDLSYIFLISCRNILLYYQDLKIFICLFFLFFLRLRYFLGMIYYNVHVLHFLLNQVIFLLTLCLLT